MADYFWNYPIIKDYLLPFLLVFTLVFAILEKSELLGKGKRQINAIVALSIGLLLMGFSNYISFIKDMMIFLVTILGILFVFMLLYGFAAGDTSGKPLDRAVQIVIFVIISIALVIAILIYSGKWDKLIDFIKNNQTVVYNIIFVIVIIGAIVTVLLSGKSKPEKKE